MAAAPPFVRPRVGDGAARAFGECRADVHRGDLGLPVFALANRIGAGFRQQQRLVAGDVLQPREIRAQLGFAMQIDVERAHVEDRQVEKLCGRKVHVGEQRLGRCGLCVFVEVAKKSFDTDVAVPAHHTRRNFVAERHHQQRGMAAERSRVCGDLAPNRLRQRAIVEECDVLRPRQARDDAESVARGFVEQVDRRRCVGADRVDAEVRHHAEILGDAFGGWKLIAVRVWRERAVRHALDEKSVVADLQKLAVRDGSRVDPRRGKPRHFRKSLCRRKS